MRPNPLASLLVLSSALVSWTACLAPLDLGAPPEGEGDPTPSAAHIVAEPSAPLESLPRVVRLTVHGIDEGAPGELRLFEGELSDAQCGLASSPQLPATLQARLVPALVWRTGEAQVLAPTVALLPGHRYTLLHGGVRLVTVRIASDDPLPLMTLRWPPAGRSLTGALGVWCGEKALPESTYPEELAPSGMTGAFRTGVAPAEAATRCVHFQPAEVVAQPDPFSLPPPWIAGRDGTPLARLEPIALTRADVFPSSEPPLVCEAGFEPFGPGCARVEDDRLLFALPSGPRLYSVQSVEPGVAIDHVFPGEGGRRLLWPLPPSSTFWLSVTTLDAAGGVSTFARLLETHAPMPHLVIDEVMANPIGAEPAQEWVELTNDGLAPAELGGLRFGDVDGEVLLPSMELAPGARALLVHEAYDASGKYDPAPSKGSLVVRLPKLAKNGLANGGEPLELRDPFGRVLSSFPAMKGKPGRSAFRRDSKSLDGFATSALGGSTPGAPNEGMVASELP